MVSLIIIVVTHGVSNYLEVGNLTCFMGNHLSNTTCLTHDFFKCGKSFGELFLTRRNTCKTNDTVLDK